jgi:CBS domain-containing protein
MESERPEDELLIAGAGPLLSAALGAAFMAAAWAAEGMGLPAPIHVVAGYLGFINLLLAAFNLLPGFPLDGGRLFRALVWKATGDLTRATRAATRGGRWLGYGLMALGFLQVFAGGVLGGLWLVFIGWFLRGAAEMSLRQHLLTEALRGVPASAIMSADPETVPGELKVRSLVEDYLLRRRYQSYPVVQGGRLAGLVTLEHAKACPREAWDATTVAEIMIPADEAMVVEPGDEMIEVLRRMSDSGVRRVLVVRDGALVGLVSASDVAEWTRRSQELGVWDEPGAPTPAP